MYYLINKIDYNNKSTYALGSSLTLRIKNYLLTKMFLEICVWLRIFIYITVIACKNFMRLLVL